VVGLEVLTLLRVVDLVLEAAVLVGSEQAHLFQ
jgi:hypothetical protein